MMNFKKKYKTKGKTCYNESGGYRMKKEKKQKNSKYSLLKVIGIAFVLFAILTWIVPAGVYSGMIYSEYSEGTNPVGLFGLFVNPTYSFGIFVQYFLVFLAIGGFYGVLNKTGAYGNFVSKLSKKLAKHKKICLVGIAVLLTLLSAIIGNSIALFVLVPLFIAILMNVGYDKITSLAATVGAILVGVIGSIFGTDVVFISFLGTEVFKGIWFKVIFFCLVTILYSFFLLYRSGQIKFGKKKKANKEEVLETKEVEIPLFEQVENKRSSLPFLIIYILTCVLILIGTLNWDYTFKVTLFTDFHTALTEIGWLSKLLGGIPAIGYFGNYDITAILLIATFIIKWLYSVKLDTFIDAFQEGAKKMLKPAIYVMLASVIFAVMVNDNYNISATISNWLFKMPEQLFTLMMILLGYVGGFFFNDFPYLVNSFYGALSTFEASTYPVMQILLQTGYGMAMLSLPVSVILVAGLKYLNVSYKEWMKYIYQFLLVIFVLVIIFALIALAI